MKTRLLYLAISLLTISCSSYHSGVKEVDFDVFENEIALKGQIPDMGDTLLTISNMAIMDDYLICYDIYNKWDYMIKVYDLGEEFQLKAKWGKRGKGPNEISNPGMGYFDYANKKICVEDYGKNKLFTIDLDSAVNIDGYLPSLQKLVLPVTEIIVDKKISNGVFIACSQKNTQDIIMYGDKGEVIKKSGEPFVKYSDQPLNAFCEMMEHYLCVDNISGRIAVLYKFQDRISVFDSLGNEQYDIVGPDFLRPKIEFTRTSYKHKKSEKAAYRSGYCTNKYIFGGYLGRENTEPQKGGGSELNYPTKLNVFLWDGTPVAQISLDHEFYSFVVDEKRQKLIVEAPTEFYPFVVYDLSKILTK